MKFESSQGPQGVMSYRSVMIKSAVIVLFMGCILFSPLRNISFENPVLTKIDTASTAYLDQTLKQATIAYGVARLTNGLVSVLQEIDLGVEFGIVATMNPFEILDPLNDLVERVSWVLLLSIISISVQEFLIRFFSTSVLYYILLPGLTLWLAGLWLNRFLSINLIQIGKQLVFLAIVLRFIIPVEVSIGNRVYTTLLKPRHDAAIEAIQAGNDEIKSQAPDVNQMMTANESEVEENPPETGMWGAIKNNMPHPFEKSKKMYAGIRQLPETFANFKEMYAGIRQLPETFANFKDRMETLVPELISNFLSLIVVFVINTVVLPILTLWLMVYLLRIITHSQAGYSVEEKFKDRIFGQKEVKKRVAGTR